MRRIWGCLWLILDDVLTSAKHWGYRNSQENASFILYSQSLSVSVSKSHRVKGFTIPWGLQMLPKGKNLSPSSSDLWIMSGSKDLGRLGPAPRKHWSGSSTHLFPWYFSPPTSGQKGMWHPENGKSHPRGKTTEVSWDSSLKRGTCKVGMTENKD